MKWPYNVVVREEEREIKREEERERAVMVCKVKKGPLAIFAGLIEWLPFTAL